MTYGTGGDFSGARMTVALSPAIVRQVRGSMFQTLDPRFFFIMLFSLLFHVGIVVYIYQIKVPPTSIVDIEMVPERFARLIIEKPIPKTPAKAVQQETSSAKKEIPKKEEKKDRQIPGEKAPKVTAAERERARKAVAKRAARVEQKMRTVGVLGMLTGVGATAKGPSVVDVLGAMGTRSESGGSLDEALAKMSGLKQVSNVEVLQKKLVKSKDVAIQHKEEIDDLVASIGSAKSVDLEKRGQFVIQKPESIDGAASSNAKRDNMAINAVVASHKTSIRMSYEKYLKRDPSLAGKVTVRFTIAASGAVTAITILENTTGSSDLESEIKRKIRMWRFESISEGDVTVTYPFVFMPAT
ncbi:MAG: energy transducer TonB [Chitinispirillaceae bacterium]|nr:energy transducer TonB [Chitinispirillaceae bacterium]